MSAAIGPPIDEGWYYDFENPGQNDESLAVLATSLIEAGVDLLQLRDKHVSDRELLDRPIPWPV